MSSETNQILLKNSIFKIGNVFSVEGRQVKIKVDKDKNLSHLIYKGKLIKNVTVGGYVKILKGFISIIAKVESEHIIEERIEKKKYGKEENKIKRILIVKLLGFLSNGGFERGIKELPLIDNECFLLDRDEFNDVHDFVAKGDEPLEIGSLTFEDAQKVQIGVNSLFASHIGIFGNTGSGKSYTLAKLYRTLFEKFKNKEGFQKRGKFLLFDFNGEYSSKDAIVAEKTVYNLVTRTEQGDDKLPFSKEDLLDVELFSILANATEKTQKPFIKRALDLYKYIMNDDSEPLNHFKNLVKSKVKDVLKMTDKIRAHLLIDYLGEIIPYSGDLTDGIEWNNKYSYFFLRGVSDLHQFTDSEISDTLLYNKVDEIEFKEDFLLNTISFMYVQLITDVLSNRAQNEHIAPAINKLKSFHKDFSKVIIIGDDQKFWKDHNFCIINLDNSNIHIKKIIPLLLSHKCYDEHKKIRSKNPDTSLNIIIDEAHNILSFTSERESDTWKDYRLETFEEIIKEGRKFGVFLTIASQRPHDISPTIISQLHNYFLHRLINNNDIVAIERTVSYLDKVSFDTLPILPTGNCILAGLFTHVPVIVNIDHIEGIHEPANKTIDLVKKWSE